MVESSGAEGRIQCHADPGQNPGRVLISQEALGSFQPLGTCFLTYKVGIRNSSTLGQPET